MPAFIGELVAWVGAAAISKAIWLIVGLVGVVGAAVLLLIVAASGALELRQERRLHCPGCGRGGPWPERVMMAVREQGEASCPDCGGRLSQRRLGRSVWRGRRVSRRLAAPRLLPLLWIAAVRLEVLCGPGCWMRPGFPRRLGGPRLGLIARTAPAAFWLSRPKWPMRPGPNLRGAETVQTRTAPPNPPRERIPQLRSRPGCRPQRHCCCPW